MTGLELEEVHVKRPHTVEKVDEALLAYAVLGNFDQVEEATGVDQATVRFWRKRYPNRFLALSQKAAPQIERQIVASMRENVLSAAAGIQEAVDATRAQIANGDAKDASAAGRNLATIAGISVDKILTLEGRPTSITEHRSGEDALKTLETMGKVLDVTYEEDPPTNGVLSSD